MTNVQWIVKLLQESGLTETEIVEFLAIVYGGLTLNQDLESKISYINSKYVNAFSLISDEVYGLVNEDLLELNSYSSEIPFKSEALFWLNGDIVYDGGSYYFLDWSGNTRHFLITGYDFDTNWVKGFPYKTSATISAPAGDSTLVAADINNFLYDSGGTPNQIPVVSLFQDIDYEHRLFCRHAPQVLDSNGIEVYEPRVLDIVLYANVKTGVDLTICQSYYGIPTESETAKWVAKDGVDAVDRGSKSQPFLTINYAIARSSAGGTIYVKTGGYTEVTGSYGCLLQKQLYMKGLGRTEILYAGASHFIYLYTNTTGTTLERFIFTPTSSSDIIYINHAAALNININNCRFEGISSIAHINLYVGSIDSFRDNIFVGTSAYLIQTNGAQDIEVKGCYIGGTLTTMGINNTGSTNFLYNKVNLTLASTGYLLNSVNDATIKFNDICFLSNCYGIVLNRAIITPHVIDVSYNKVRSNYTIANLVNLSLATSGTYTANNNDIYLSASSGLTTILNLIRSDFDIENNILVSNSASTGDVIAVRSGAYSPTVKSIKNNYIKCPLTSGHLIYLGNEQTGAGDNYIDGAEVMNNYCDNVDKHVHGILSGFCKNTKIKYNKVENCDLAIVMKGDSSTINTEGLVAYNVVNNFGGTGIYWKGISDGFCYGNTVKGSDSNYYFQTAAYEGDASIPQGVTIKNNIFNCAELSSYIYTIIDDEETFTIDKNVIYTTNSSGYYANVASVDKNLTQWRAFGFDTNSSILSPNLISTLLPVPLIIGGEDLGTDYDDGLDITTDWGSETEVPSIVTKQQGDNWQIGAYVQ